MGIKEIKDHLNGLWEIELAGFIALSRIFFV